MSKGRNYKGIEIFRVLAAFLVVAIHTSPLTIYSVTADFILTRVIARVAVPFFFMVTGYFVLSKGTGVRSFIKKTAIIYAASAALYLPVNVYAGLLQEWTLLDLVREAFFEGTFYHLWYLPAAILGAWLTSLIMRRCSRGAGLRHSLGALCIRTSGRQLLGTHRGRPGCEQCVQRTLCAHGLHAQRALFRADVHADGRRPPRREAERVGFEFMGLAPLSRSCSQRRSLRAARAGSGTTACMFSCPS